MNINKSALWSKNEEISFFKEYASFASPEQLFYHTDDDKYLAYWPKNYKGKTSTRQSRNSLIGNFTERWTTNLINSILADDDLFAFQGVSCPKIGLTSSSPADIIITDRNSVDIQPENIKLIFEVKMSLLWNWQFDSVTSEITEVGDYKTHKGNPSLLRSDSVLKAIGKCLNIRISDYASSNIPLIVIGNSPISKTYYSKVDHLKKTGIIQGFWSITPEPLNNEKTLTNTYQNGFQCFKNENQLKNAIYSLLDKDLNFFSGMNSIENLGKIIEISNEEETYEQKGYKFLQLIRDELDG